MNLIKFAVIRYGGGEGVTLVSRVSIFSTSYFTSTSVVTSHENNACSVFASQAYLHATHVHVRRTHSPECKGHRHGQALK